MNGKRSNILLNSRISLMLSIVIITIISIYSFLFSIKYKNYDLELIGQENLRTLHSLDTSLDTIIKNADDYSKMVVADATIQSAMDSGSLLEDASLQSEAIKKLYSIFQFSDYVDSIWLIDQKGQKLTVGGNASLSVSRNLDDFQYLRKAYGSYQILLFSNKEQPQISLVRSYNNTNAFHSLGIIGVDINYNMLCKVFEDAIGTEGEIAVYDKNGERVFRSGTGISESVLQEDFQANDEKTSQRTIDGQRYIVTKTNGSSIGWTLIRYMPVPRIFPNNELARFSIISIMIVGATILICAVMISRMLTVPIQQLLSCMKEMSGEHLVKINANPVLSEFKTLFHGYNRMVDQIQELIASTIEKQKRIRQIELNEMQEQMKPHFLYNTLDSIQALALMGESQKVCSLVENLGDFYRKSVSGGREFITLAEEFRMIRDYIDIMKVRFDGRFGSAMECSDEAANYLIPKLILQPLVENSFQYGIRGRDQYGKILITANCSDGFLHLCVEDDGPGLPEEILKELTAETFSGKGKSLGLRGTIERLRLYFGKNFTYRISSENGASIHLYILLEELVCQNTDAS